MSKSRIGSNLVFVDLPDEEEFYTLDNYRLLLEQYSAYLDYIGYLEFSHVLNVSPDEAVKLGNYARSLGFETWSIHSEHLNVNDTLEKYLTIQTHEAEVCAALGCQVMVCHLPNLVPYVDFERDLDVIGKVAELTHACGLRLAVETCGYQDGDIFRPDADLVIRVVEALDMPDVGINLDTGHCLIGQSGRNQETLEKILSGEIEQNIPALVKRIGKGLRSQVGTMFSTLEKGPRYLEMAEGYVLEIGLDANSEIIGYKFVHLGKMMEAIRKGVAPAEAFEANVKSYGRFDEAVKKIDPRKE